MDNKTVYEAKMDDYSCKLNDFKADHELMIMITLNEYRELVSKVAELKEKVRWLESSKS